MAYNAFDPMSVYNETLNLNQANYQNILNTFSSGQANLSAQLPSIYSGYGNTLAGIKSTLGIGGGGWGVAAPAAEAIKQTFAQTSGQNVQRAINAGLGNTTVLPNLQNQASLMAGQAYGGLGAQLAQTYAGYQAQFGLAEQQARMQGLSAQTGLYGQEGSTLGGYRFANTSGAAPGAYGYGAERGGVNSQFAGTGIGASDMAGQGYTPPGGRLAFNQPVGKYGTMEMSTYGGGGVYDGGGDYQVPADYFTDGGGGYDEYGGMPVDSWDTGGGGYGGGGDFGGDLSYGGYGGGWDYGGGDSYAGDYGGDWGDWG